MRTTLQILLFLTTAALTAQEIPLPLSAPLEAGTISIKATYADITIEIDPQATPFLEARAFDNEGPAPGLLEKRLERGVEHWIRGADGAGSERPVYEIRVVVGRGQNVRISGVDLNISIRDLEPREGKAGAGIEIDVESSDVELMSIRGAALKGRSTFLRSNDGRGDYVLELDRCRLELDGHRGSLNLTAQNGESILQHLNGRLEIDTADHRLDVVTAEVQAQGKAEGGTITIDDWQGSVDLELENVLFEALTARTVRSQLNIKGRAATVTAVGLVGTTFVNLQGGSFVGRDLDGTTQAVIRGQGTTELQNVAGVVKLNLTEGASARLADLTGRVRAATTEGVVEAERIFSLKVEAIRSRVTALDIRRQEAVSLTDSEIDLDMINAEDASALILRGNSAARVRVPQPCMVRVNSAPEVEPEQIQIAGCDFPSPQEAAQPKMREAGTLVLTASLRDASRLRVDGVER